MRDEDAVVFGYRDAAEAASDGSQDVKDTGMHAFDLGRVGDLKIEKAAEAALEALLRDGLSGFWVHLDADVLDDGIMPAGDYRLPGGLSFEDLGGLLRVLLGTNRAIGMSVTIFNPALDEDGRYACGLDPAINAGLDGGPGGRRSRTRSVYQRSSKRGREHGLAKRGEESQDNADASASVNPCEREPLRSGTVVGMDMFPGSD